MRLAGAGEFYRQSGKCPVRRAMGSATLRFMRCPGSYTKWVLDQLGGVVPVATIESAIGLLTCLISAPRMRLRFYRVKTAGF